MSIYINKLQANGNTLEEAIEDFKRKLEYVMDPLYPKEFETREINGQKYIYYNGEWALQLDEVTVTAKAISNVRAFIIAPEGIRLHKTAHPNDPGVIAAREGRSIGTANISTKIYKPGEEILYIGPSQHAEGWALVKTSDSKQGHIQRHHILILAKNAILDNFTKAYYYVAKQGEGVESIINQYYSNYNFKRGKDKRTIAEALIFLNQTSGHQHGLYFKQEEKGVLEKIQSGVVDAHDPWFKKARDMYTSVQIPLHTVLRIPTEAYIDYLDTIGKLSKRPDLINEMINVGEIVVDVAAGIAGVIVGIVEGFVMGIWDALVGLVDLVTSIIDVVKKLLSGTFIKDLEKMYAMMMNLSWEQIKEMGDAITGGLITQIKNFGNLSAFEKGRVIGKIIGAVILEVVLAIFTGGAVNAAKWAGKLGKFASVAKKVAKAGDDILGPLNKMNKKLLDDLKNKIPTKYKNKFGKGDYDDKDEKNIYRQLLLNQARATAEILDANGSTIQELLSTLNTSEKIYPKLGNVKWPTKHIQDNIYSIGMVASDEKWVDKHFTSGDGERREEMKEWKDYGQDIKGTKKYRPHEIKAFLEVEKKFGIKTRPSKLGEAGDIIGLTGKFKDKSIDLAGLEPKAIPAWKRNPIKNFNKFKGNVEKHFKKMEKIPPLDVYILDLKYLDDIDKSFRKQLMDYIYNPDFKYSKFVNDEKFKIIN